MSDRIKRLFVLSAISFAFADAHAQCGEPPNICTSAPRVVVSRYTSESDPNPHHAFHCTGINETINVELLNVHFKVVIRCEPATADLGRIIICGSGENLVSVLITTDFSSTSNNPPPSAANDWDGMQDLRGNIAVRAGISGDLTNDINLTHVSDNSDELKYLRVGGTIEAGISIGGGGPTPNFGTVVEAASILAPGDITKAVGRIDMVRVEPGPLLSDIRATGGSIGEIDVIGGDIGSSANPVIIEAAAASSGLHIGRINTSRDFYGNVDCNTATTGVDGVIETFFVGLGANPTVAGDFHGSLRLGSFVEQVTIVRDFFGTVVHGSTLDAGTQSVPHQIGIGRSFKSGASISIDTSQGLKGHVGINRILNAGGTWESGATVTIGSTILSQHNYSSTFASIGGGSVGLTPYRLHNESCTPPNGGVATSACPGNNVVVLLRHYGPLTWTPASGLPATITRRIACTSDSFASAPNVNTTNFALDDDNPNAAEPLRSLKITYPFAAGYEYKITPTTNLKCFGGGTPAVEWNADYVIRMKSSCNADIAGPGGLPNGVVDIDDLLRVISGWGTCPNPSCCVADIVGGNGVVNIDDLLAVITGWGTCPTCTGEAEDMPQSVQDCMDKCSEAYPGMGDDWGACVDICVQGLCDAHIISCN